jgi:tRNA G18 (ribose-2'-O)-methylase SpoU
LQVGTSNHTSTTTTTSSSKEKRMAALAEDRGKAFDGARDNGRYSVSFVPVTELDLAASPIPGLERLLYCKEHFPEKELWKVAAAEGNGDDDVDYDVVPLEFRSWKGAILNVSGTLSDLPLGVPPGEEEEEEDGDREKMMTDKQERARKIAGMYVIAVKRTRVGERTRAPILVLAGLRYRGNVGTIVRTAVQANRFEEIIIVDPAEGGEKVPGEKLVNNRVTKTDVDYYSMQNAPLIKITRMKSVDEFLERAEGDGRGMVATALTASSLDVYGREAAEFLKRDDMYLLLGCETSGLEERVMERCVCVEIPSLSASINVGCACSIVITCMILAKRESE